MSLRTFLLFVFLIASFKSYGQFWFGVKSGAQFTNQVYQEKAYKDSYDPKNIVNWHIGTVINYTNSEKYSIHMELLYERAKRRIDDVRNVSDSIILRSEFTYHFITAPVMFRVQFGKAPIRYYINAGPQFRLWAAGKARIEADELNENSAKGHVNLRVSFKDPSETPAGNKYYVPNSNRIQYAFLAGGGVVLDLFNKPQRLMIDGRYAFGHSIMAFNRGTEPSALQTYAENFEFRDNTVTISLAYLFGFDPVDLRKGASTVKAKKLK